MTSNVIQLGKNKESKDRIDLYTKLLLTELMEELPAELSKPPIETTELNKLAQMLPTISPEFAKLSPKALVAIANSIGAIARTLATYLVDKD
jgi:hypothetical protein